MMHTAAVNNYEPIVLHKHQFSFIRGKCPRAQLLGHMVSVCCLCWNRKWFSRVLLPFRTPFSSVWEGPGVQQSRPCLGVFSASDVLLRVRWSLCVASICISPGLWCHIMNFCALALPFPHFGRVLPPPLHPQPQKHLLPPLPEYLNSLGSKPGEVTVFSLVRLEFIFL